MIPTDPSPDECIDAAADGEPEPDRRADIHHVRRETADVECIEQIVDDIGNVVEAVGEPCSVRGVTVPKSLVIRRDDVIGVG